MQTAVNSAPQIEYRSMNGPSIPELQERLAKSRDAAKAIDEQRAAANAPGLTEEEQTAFDKHVSEARSLQSAIDRQRSIDDIDRKAAPAITRSGGRDGTYEERAREFSLVKAIVDQTDPGSVDAGKEREISAELAKRSGKAPRGTLVPHEAFQERRALLTSNTGGELYPTRHRDDLFIDRLRETLRVGQLGATVLSGLVGDQEISRMTSSLTGYWIAEHENVTESDVAFDSVLLKPKTVGGQTQYSRRMLINASPDIENLIRRDLSSVIATAIDKAALTADGTGNMPTGLLSQTGTTKTPVDGSELLSSLLEFQTLMTTDNALAGNLSWLVSPKAYKFLRVAQRSAETPLMTTPGMLIDHPILQSTHIPIDAGAGNDETPIIFGNWSDLMVGYWSGIDVLANPYHADVYSKGGVMINALQDVDVAVRHPESFVISTGLVV